ncbi:MAG: pyridoxamine 5'-phosphate oxidase family protein, partial [Aestuariivirga sp.]
MAAAPSERTRVKRLNKRAKYDAETVHGILDAMPVCSVGYVFKGAPFVTTTLQWREGDHIFWHGSAASRMLEACENAEVCVSVSIIDGFVMARSAFNHSCNYRSVMVFGTAR